MMRRKVIDDDPSSSKRVKTAPSLIEETPTRENGNIVPATPASLRKIRKHLFATPGGVVASPATPDTATPELKRFRKIVADPNREPMKVFLRVRPLSREENEKGETHCITTLRTDVSQIPSQVIIKAPKDTLAYRATGESESRYSFTRVFGETTDQKTLFDDTALPLVDSFIKGTNGLLFAYGITNAGKTYTITGSKEEAGVLPRVLKVLFNSINRNNKNSKKETSSKLSISMEYDEEEEEESLINIEPGYRYSVWMSYLEIYNERIFDLLDEQVVDPTKKEILKLKEDKAGHVFVKGLKEVHVKNAEEGHDLLQKGFKNRQVANTMLNQDSSRSHSVIVFKLIQVPEDKDSAAIKKDTSLIKYSKLSIIDLAGSERNSRTKTTGARLKEASNINTSLMTFGRCLEALRWNQQHPNSQKIVPFRDSKLTRLFQDYFIGNGKASMIVNVSPCSSDYEETCNVLKFSAVAKEITISKAVEKPNSRPVNTIDIDQVLDLDNNNNNNNNEELENRLKELQEYEISLREERESFEAEKVLIEESIRKEVSEEIEETMHSIQMDYDKRLQQEINLLEIKYKQSLELIGKQRIDREDDSKLAVEVKKLRSKDESNQSQIVVLKSQIKQFDKEKTELINRISLLEEELSTMQLERDKEILYWQQRLSKEQSHYESSVKSLQCELEHERRESESLKQSVRDNQSSSKTYGNTYVHSPQVEQNEGTKKKQKIVTTPTKKDLQKYANYEVVDVKINHNISHQSPITTLFKGQVQKSVTGDGYSVVLTDMEIHSKDNVVNTPIKSGVQHDTEQLTPQNTTSTSIRTSSPRITLSPPNSNSETVLFDPLQDSLVMQEVQDEDMLEEISLEDEPKGKKQGSKKAKNQEKLWQKGKDLAKKVLPLHIPKSPKASPSTTPRKAQQEEREDKENQPASNQEPKKRVRKLFSSKHNEDVLLNQEEPEEEEKPSPKKKVKSSKKQSVKETPPPIAKRTRGRPAKQISYF